MLGRYDIDVAAPVLEQLKTQGIDVTGPVPGDTVFVKRVPGNSMPSSRCITIRATSR